MAEDSTCSDFLPTASWENLRLRAQLLRRVREFFDSRGFLEVETPILSADTVIDRHLDPFPVVLDDRDAGGPRPRHFWLQTSPELGMKRLLAAGATAIYQVARAFRQGEFGPWHNCEFTLVEWYRAGDGLSEGMGLLSDLCESLLGRGSAERVTYGEAFAWHVGTDPHTATTAELAARARALNIPSPGSLSLDDRDGWLDLLFVEGVQPHLGHARPVIVYDYPASQAALARLRAARPPVAERFELYVAGMELANGYHELADPQELRQRHARQNAWRRADGKPSLPEPTRLVAAMEAGLPDATGVALGFDRVVMIAAGASEIRQVIAFPFDRA